MLDLSEVLQWGEWRPLEGAWRDPAIPAEPGISRIRRVGHEDLDYIGHSGTDQANIRARLGHLRNIYREVRPASGPHVAAPGLWELRQLTGEEFEVSVAPVTGPTSWLRGLVALTIALYRQAHHRSPTVQFGRLPTASETSTSSSQQLMEPVVPYLGPPGATPAVDPAPSVPPVGPLDGDPTRLDWGGHAWSPWTPLAEIAAFRNQESGTGLYRIRGHQQRQLIAIRQGNVKQRLNDVRRAGDPAHPHAGAHGNPALLEVSWVVNDSWDYHQRLELVNDLKAAHFLVTGELPTGQPHD